MAVPGYPAILLVREFTWCSCSMPSFLPFNRSLLAFASQIFISMRNSTKVVNFSLGGFAMVGFLTVCVGVLTSIAYVNGHLDSLLESSSTTLSTFVNAHDDDIQVS